MTEEFATITFDDAEHTKKFRTYENFFSWLEEQKQKWQWLYGTQIGNNLDEVRQNFDNIRNIVQQIQNNNQPISGISGVVNQHYQPSGWLRHSEGSFAKSIGRIRDGHGDNAAAFVFGFSKNRFNLSNVSEPSQLAACLLFALPELDKPDAIAKRLEAERRNYRTSISRQLDMLDESSAKRDKTYKDHLNTARRLAIRQLSRTRRIDKLFRSSLIEKSIVAIGSITEVENTFRTKMGLQAPVQYWLDKAERHKSSADAAACRLKWYFPLAAFIFLVSFGLAAVLLLGEDTVHQTVYVIVAAGLASLAALIFWVGRLFTKLYLSYHHLMHDAEERAVMTTTYLALSHENAASDEDKKIILGALFRPTVDGLIKEDGPSDMTLAGALSKFGTSR
jgi:hypothetical protein